MIVAIGIAGLGNAVSKRDRSAVSAVPERCLALLWRRTVLRGVHPRKREACRGVFLAPRLEMKHDEAVDQVCLGYAWMQA